ncbi:MAG: alanine racemase [Lachnospiraceae bacterium]|nr:alanine racemase [Lachnospiraceae bacterium]
MISEEIREGYARGYAQIDLDAMLHNMRQMHETLAEKTRMVAVIKTDGYGHGSIPIAACLEKETYVWGYAVATPEEAFILRKNGMKKPILILGYTFPYAYERMAQEDIRPAVFEPEMAAALAEAAKRTGKCMKIHIKVDTGMGRIGIMPDEAGLSFVKELMHYVEEGLLEIEGIFTHFSRADEKDKQSARKQLALFKEFTADIEQKLGLRIPLKHCANSAGILELPESYLDLVRAGITLYGLHPSEEVPGGKTYLKPVLSLYSHVVYVKTIHVGQSISYGGTFTAQKDMRVATIPLGYGDGYPRSLSGGKGYVLIRGQKAPILGRVCMDQFMVDVSDIPDVTTGELVTLIGRDGALGITAEELGELSGRFNYELVCDLSKRVPRVFVKKGAIVATQDMDGCHVTM